MENQSYVESVKRTSIVQSFFAQVYGWMFFGLLSTGIVAYYTAHSPALLNLIFGSQITFYAFLFAPIVLVRYLLIRMSIQLQDARYGHQYRKHDYRQY